jgi:hypothetical protein
MRSIFNLQMKILYCIYAVLSMVQYNISAFVILSFICTFTKKNLTWGDRFDHMDRKPCPLHTHAANRLPHVGKEKLTSSPLVSIYSHPRSTHIRYDPQETTKYDNVTSHSLAVCTVYVKKNGTWCWINSFTKMGYCITFVCWKILTLPVISMCLCTVSFFFGFAINSTPSSLMTSMHISEASDIDSQLSHIWKS